MTNLAKSIEKNNIEFIEKNKKSEKIVCYICNKINITNKYNNKNLCNNCYEEELIKSLTFLPKYKVSWK